MHFRNLRVTGPTPLTGQSADTMAKRTRPSPVTLRQEPITWRTDDLSIGRVETILGRNHVADFFEDRSRKRAINAAVARARGAWDANDRERYAAYRSLARLLGRRYEE